MEKSLKTGWVTARKIVQYLALAAFIGLFIVSRRGGWASEVVNIPMRLDPLLTLANAAQEEQYAWIAGGEDPASFASRYLCLLYTSPSPRDRQKSRMPSSA